MSSGSQNRQRQTIIGFRVTEEEKAAVLYAAAERGMSVAAYIRTLALEAASPTTELADPIAVPWEMAAHRQ